MMKTKTLLIVTLFALVGANVILPGRFLASAQHEETAKIARPGVSVDDYYETIVSIPVKSGIFAYSNLGQNEKAPHGPNSISISDEGSFIIGNHVDNTVTELSRTGEIVNRMKFDDATAIMDAVKVSGEFFALDRGADQPYVLSIYGYKVADAPTDAFRLSTDNNAHFVSSPKVTRADGQDIAIFSGTKANRTDKLKVRPGNPSLEDANYLKVWLGMRQIVSWRASHPIVETRLLGSTAQGDFFVVVLEIVSEHSIVLDQKVLHFNFEGKLLNQARVPQEQAIPIDNDTVLSHEGDVFVLMPREESLDIIKLKFKDSLAPLRVVEDAPIPPMPIEDTNAATTAQTLLISASVPTVTRQQIANIANWYFNSSTYIPAVSISGSCRKKPSYLGTAKSYPSVPYSWGGGDSPADFANKMSRNVVAGHNANYYSTCSVLPAGVDCSGFVAQTWGMPGHPFSTSSVVSGGYAYSINRAQLRQGDALNLSGTHILLYVRDDNNTVWTWESTGDPGAERALAWQRSWKSLSNYVFLRYTGLPVTQPSPRITTTSNWGVVYEYSTAVYTVSPGQSIYFTFDSSRSSANVGGIDSRTWKINGSTVSNAQSFGYWLGRGTHNIALTVINSDGGSSTATQQIVINEVQIVPPPRITSISPSVIKPQTSIWLHVFGTGFAQGLRAQVRTPAGGPWQIDPSGVLFVNSGELWISVWMGYGSYNATLEVVNPNGVIASGQFTVKP